MTVRTAEIAGVVTLTFVTAMGAAIEANMDGLLAVLITVGASAVSGYFSARITAETRFTQITAELHSLRAVVELQGQEFRRYYRRRGEDHE